jgi:DNA-binding transcriptional ArsR family regulator
MVKICKKLLEHIGVNPHRLRLEWVSAGEGIRFANVMNEFAVKIQSLGPLGSSEGIDYKTLQFKLEAAKKLIPYIKLVERERLRPPLQLRASSEPQEEYNKFFSSDELNRIFNETIVDKLMISQIRLLLKNGPLTTGEISDALGLSSSEVSRYLSSSSKHGLVRYDESLKRYASA